MSAPTRAPDRLGVAFVGSGFNARFHMQGFQAVRDADVRGVWSPNAEHANSAAALARSLDIGAAKAYASIRDMVADPAIDALWLTGPNHSRIENMEEIVHAIESGLGTLRGIACEKPLARNVAEAKRFMALMERTGAMQAIWRTVFARIETDGCSPGERRGQHRPSHLAALPRNTAGRTPHGSGAASCKEAGC